jgi:hypothetical protein
VFPETTILSREMFSRARFCAAADVGAQCRDVLREGRVEAWRAQPGLHMHKGDLAVERGDRRRIGGRRIPLGQDAIRPDLPEIFVQAANEQAGENRRRATIASVRDREVRMQAEFGEGAVEQIALLA